MHREKAIVTSTLLLLVSIYGHPTVLANPSDKDVEAALAIHDVANSQELLAQTQKLYEQATKTIQGIMKSGGRTNARSLTQVHLSIRQLRRSALDLQLHGEPAGFDFNLRAGPLQEVLNNAVAQFKRTQPGVAHANKIRMGIRSTKAIQARTAALQRVKQLIQQKKWQEAYTVLNEGLDDLTSAIIFLEFEETRDFLTPFSTVMISVPDNRNKLVRQQLLDSLGQAAAAQKPGTQDLLERIAAAANGLRTAPTANIDGRSFTGPQCLDGFARVWKQVHLSALRCRAIEWARHVNIPVAMAARPASEPNMVDDTEYALFHGQIVEALASLVEADADRATGDEAAGLYRQYIQIFAPLVTRTADDKLEVAATAALEKLAAKSPGFAAEVKAYQDATGELLRWRERVAGAKTRSHAAQFQPSDQLMLRLVTSKADFKGLIQERNPNLNGASLIGSCPEVLSVASQGAIDQQITVGNVVGLAGTTFSVARYNLRHYAMVAKPDIANEIQSLKSDLFATDAAAPLSLPAAAAIHSAEQGDYVAVGGAVKGIHLEGLIPRFAVLSEAASPFVALGPLPGEPDDDRLLSHVLMRFDVLPKWAQHKYFFIQLDHPTASTSGG